MSASLKAMMKVRGRGKEGPFGPIKNRRRSMTLFYRVSETQPTDVQVNFDLTSTKPHSALKGFANLEE